jgi:hypothetical protein
MFKDFFFQLLKNNEILRKARLIPNVPVEKNLNYLFNVIPGKGTARD